MKKVNPSKRISKGIVSKKKEAKPPLTSLIDVMTILLVFLMKSFSDEGTLVTVKDDIELAQSVSKAIPETAVNLIITEEKVSLGEVEVMSLKEIAESEELLLPKLQSGLKSYLMQHSNKNKIVIQCDKKIDYKILKKILFTCGKSSIKDFSLLVVREA